MIVVRELLGDNFSPQISPASNHNNGFVEGRLQRRLLVGFACLLAAFTLAMVCLFALKARRSNRQQQHDRLELGHSARKFLTQVHHFPFREMKLATNGFADSRRLGGGGFGTVFAGVLADGRVAAIKILHRSPNLASPQFLAEIAVLSQFKHPNLVQLLGCSADGASLALVYEFISNGTLADHLYAARRRRLPWLTRLSIAIDIAQVLAYLHASRVLHRDVKSTNVLLDEAFHAKLADFGLSRAATTLADSVGHVATGAQGTAGYLDPEYHQCYTLTDKSDVYSFGVVLMELVTAKPAVDFRRDRINLATFALGMIHAGNFELIIDPHLETAKNCMVRAMVLGVAEIAFRCLAPNREDRPPMEEVARALVRVAGS